MSKVVITGIGLITPCGNGKDATWAAIRAGKSGVGRITKFDASRCTSQVAGEVKDFETYAETNGLLDRKAARHMGLFSRYAVAAAVEAWKDAGLKLRAAEGVSESGTTEAASTAFQPDMKRVGTLVGVGMGGMDVMAANFKTLFDRGPDRLLPTMIPAMIPNEAAGNISMRLGAKGPAQAIVTACASSTDALGYALGLIRSGRADVVIAGGAEAVIQEFCIGGFMKMKALCTTFNDAPERASRPFNLDRAGFVMGEGAGMLILESEEHARARGAKVYCELAGYGATSDAYHITAPDPTGEGAIDAIRLSLEDAGMPEGAEIDYINAHGTSTHLNDQMETKAFKAVFGERARSIKVSSTKSMTAHMLGAAGAVEAAFCALAIRDGFVPPTINYETPDPECDLDYTPNVGVAMPIRAALSTSLGFGGHNGALVLRHV